MVMSSRRAGLVMVLLVCLGLLVGGALAYGGRVQIK